MLDKTRSFTTSIATGHDDALGSGAVCDDARHIIVSTSGLSNCCRDVFVTKLTDATHGTTECKKNLVPFDSNNHAPVFDGTKFVYFMEYSSKSGNGHRFGRVDVDTWMFEELPQLPGTKFGGVSSGCWHNGVVFAVDADKELCGFDVATNKWSRCGVKVPSKGGGACVRLLSNPHDTQNLFVMVWDGGLHKINLTTHEVSLVSNSPVPFIMPRDVLLVGCDATTFVVVAALQGGQWHMLESKTKQWAMLEGWKPFKSEFNRNYLVFMPSLRTFYFHVHETDFWEAVVLPC